MKKFDFFARWSSFFEGVVSYQAYYDIKVEVILRHNKAKFFCIALAMDKNFNEVMSQNNNTWYNNNILDKTLKELRQEK